MRFEYMQVQTALDEIDIDPLGNSSIVCTNDEGKQWYLATRTDLGWTILEQFGPVEIGLDTIGYSFMYLRNKFEYNEKKLYITIDKFLNDSKRTVSQVELIDYEQFKERLNNLQESD